MLLIWPASPGLNILFENGHRVHQIQKFFVLILENNSGDFKDICIMCIYFFQVFAYTVYMLYILCNIYSEIYVDIFMHMRMIATTNTYLALMLGDFMRKMLKPFFVSIWWNCKPDMTKIHVLIIFSFKFS